MKGLEKVCLEDKSSTGFGYGKIQSNETVNKRKKIKLST